MVIQPGEHRQARYQGQLRIVKVVCSSSEFPGYWVVEDLISQSQFKLPTSAFDPAPDDQMPDDQTPDDQTPDDGEPARGDSANGNSP